LALMIIQMVFLSCHLEFSLMEQHLVYIVPIVLAKKRERERDKS
jgi:hypothetical protein